MKLLDYSGRLNNHGDYVRVLRRLEEKCRWIEYVLVSDDDSFVKHFQNSVVSVTKRNKWWGTKSSQKREVYKIKANPEIFNYLRKLETFCLFYPAGDKGDMAEETSFGYNDISFFDDKELPLLFTTTHEGYIFIRNDLAE